MPLVEGVETHVFTVPTDLPGGDGTAAWESTTMVAVEVVAADGVRGLGYTYGSPAAAEVVSRHLVPVVLGSDPDHAGATWRRMVDTVRNEGLPGVAATAISAVDVAMWDLKARQHRQPLWLHLGAHRRAVAIYGSGGLTAMTCEQVKEQLAGWVAAGIPRVKMKIAHDWGADPDGDLERVAAVRSAIGDAELFVDANGGYTAKEALRVAASLPGLGVTWFEEPVSSDRLDELRAIRQATSLDIAAGEYGYTPWYFDRMLREEAVDVLQADITRCLGVTGFLQASTLAWAAGVPFSAHCAPALHAHVGCAAPDIAHIEYFHDHARLEQMLLSGVPTPQGDRLAPDPGVPGLGLTLRPEAEQYRVAHQAV